FSAAAGGASGAWLAARGGAADDVLAPGQGGRPLPAGRGRRLAADNEPALRDRDPARYGRHRRLVESEREFCRARRLSADAVRADRAADPAHGWGLRSGRTSPRGDLNLA